MCILTIIKCFNSAYKCILGGFKVVLLFFFYVLGALEDSCDSLMSRLHYFSCGIRQLSHKSTQKSYSSKSKDMLLEEYTHKSDTYD